VYDEFDNQAGAASIAELANHMLEQGLQSSPSAVHGCLCGLLSAGGSRQPEYALDAVAGAMDLVTHGELAEKIMQLYTSTNAALEDETFDFHPLLPDDETDLGERVAGLAEWCRGFLAGFAYARAGGEGGSPALSGDSSEILEDFAAIAQAGLEGSEDEEESESSYMELVEYLRLATLNLFMNHSGEAGQVPGDPASIH
jgi:yecA family protein